MLRGHWMLACRLLVALEVVVEVLDLLVGADHSEHVAREDAGVDRGKRHVGVAALYAGDAHAVVLA